MQRNADIQKMLRLFGKILVQSKAILRIPATECLFSIFFIQMQLHFYLVDGADPNVSSNPSVRLEDGSLIWRFAQGCFTSPSAAVELADRSSNQVAEQSTTGSHGRCVSSIRTELSAWS